MRAIVKFSKGEGVKYISHLDVLRLFQRAVLRAELPVSYSQGYNPHMLIGFACALPVGVVSSAEYMELKLAQEIAEEKLSDRLNAVLPAGIAVLRVKAVPEAGPSLAAMIRAAKYELAFERMTEELAGLPQRVLEQDQIMIEKKSKKGVKLTDIRGMVRELSQQGNCLTCELTAGNEENLRPDVFWSYLKTLLESSQETPRICRTAQLILQDGMLCDAMELH